MFLVSRAQIIKRNRFPRVCGDVSQHLFSQIPSTQAFPAYAGMFPGVVPSFAFTSGFPRVCGDVSFCFSEAIAEFWLSPRMRGCFSADRSACSSGRAFPAYAGMFPSANYPKRADLGFPRVCGDVSGLEGLPNR